MRLGAPGSWTVKGPRLLRPTTSTRCWHGGPRLPLTPLTIDHALPPLQEREALLLMRTNELRNEKWELEGQVRLGHVGVHRANVPRTYARCKS